MWGWTKKSRWMRRALFLAFIFISACSAQQKNQHDDLITETGDPFSDSFYADAPKWDDSVLRQSEILSEDSKPEPEEPESFLERSETVIFSTFLVGLMLAKLALPFLGF
jgi:hypothetical protein